MKNKQPSMFKDLCYMFGSLLLLSLPGMIAGILQIPLLDILVFAGYVVLFFTFISVNEGKETAIIVGVVIAGSLIFILAM